LSIGLGCLLKMNFCPISFLARWSGLAALVTAAMSVTAQQPIQFTKPVEADPASKANAFIPASSRNAAGAFNAPGSLFGEKNSAVDFDVLPGSPARGAVSAASAEEWRKFLERKKNWTLETPEEIMGVLTPEKLMGLTDPNEDPKLSAGERFLQRQDRRAAAAATNGYVRPGAAYRRDDARMDPLHQGDDNDRFRQILGGGNPGVARNFNPFFNVSPNLPAAQLKSDSIWANPFGMPEQLPKQTPEQLAGMERFRAMMGPSAPVNLPASGRFSDQPVAAPDPNLQVLPVFNPNGRSFSGLQNTPARPMGLTPLPGISGSPLAPAKKPDPLVQSPPWVSGSQQPLTPLQRQF
jgi:hypothetical protein